MNAAPVLTQMVENFGSSSPDGAYYMVKDDAAQVVVIGVMNFSPGDYIRALNDHLDTHFELFNCSFLGTDFLTPGERKTVLERGFVSLICRRNGCRG